jgi:hypothetical protein
MAWLFGGICRYRDKTHIKSVFYIPRTRTTVSVFNKDNFHLHKNCLKAQNRKKKEEKEGGGGTGGGVG